MSRADDISKLFNKLGANPSGYREIDFVHEFIEDEIEVLEAPAVTPAPPVIEAPSAPLLRDLYLWYFRHVLPRLGRLISKHGDAYTYLPASVDAFPAPAEFARIVAAAGFEHVLAQPLTFGVVYLYTATRRADATPASVERVN